eukprot:scaffold178529_cov38-Prasinocladus_malaysianus.AAC.1
MASRRHDVPSALRVVASRAPWKRRDEKRELAARTPHVPWAGGGASRLLESRVDSVRAAVRAVAS